MPEGPSRAYHQMIQMSRIRRKGWRTIQFESKRIASGGWQRTRVHKPRAQIVERLSGVAIAVLVAGLLLYVATRFVRPQTGMITTM